MDIGTLSLAIELFAPEQVKRDLKDIDKLASASAKERDKDNKKTEDYYKGLYKFIKQKIREILRDEKQAAREKAQYEKDFQKLVREDARATRELNMKNAQFQLALMRFNSNAEKKEKAEQAAWWIRFYAEKERTAKKAESEIRRAQRETARQERKDNEANASYQLAKMRDADRRVTDRYYGLSRAQRAIIKAEAAAYREAERMKTAETRKGERERMRIRRNNMLRFRTAIGGGIGITGGFSAAIVGAAAVREVFTAANQYQLLQQRLTQVSETSRDAKVTFNELMDASIRLRVPAADLTELFVKLRQSNAAVGHTVGQTIQVTRAFSAALRISGASGQAASSALLQFGQAMAKGRLDGDEFRSVAENASEVLRVLERYLNETGAGMALFGAKSKITRGEILKFREEGKLTSDVMAKALLWDLAELERRVANLPPTLEQAAASFKSNMIKMVGGSQDLQQAMQNLANSIAKVGDFIGKNGSTIIGIVKTIAVVGGLTIAATRLMSAVSLLSEAWKTLGAAMGLASKANLVIGALTTIASLYSIIRGYGLATAAANEAAFGQRVQTHAKRFTESLYQMAAAMTEQDKATARSNFMNLMSQYTTQAIEARDKIILLKQAIAALPPDVSMKPWSERTEEDRTNIANRTRLNAELRQAEEQLRFANAVMTEVGQTGDALMKGGATPEIVKDVKEVKDTLDEYISTLLTLRKAGIDTTRVNEQLNKVLDDQARIISNTNATQEARAQAFNRQSTILKEMLDQLPDLSKLGEDIGKAIDKSLGQEPSMMKSNRLKFIIDNADAYAESTELLTDADLELVRTSRLVMLAEIGRLMAMKSRTAEQDKALLSLVEYEKALAKILSPDAPDAKRDRLGERLDRQLADMLRLAPGQLITGYFEALGDKVEEGGETLADKMRKALGDAFGRIGPNLIQQGIEKIAGSKAIKQAFSDIIMAIAGPTTVLGGFIKSIGDALKANPLLAGVALIAIGGAMAAYAKSLGGNVSNAMSGRGGDFNNSLGIGGAASTIPYVFQNRPWQSPMQNMATVPNAAQPVTVNATIIGPNDPQAQRQIADLVNNASRRGLVAGGSARTL